MSQSGTFGTGGVTPPSGAVLQIIGDSGSALPNVGGAINLFGSTNIETSAAANTVTITLTDDVTISGNFTTTDGNINLPTTLSSGLEGVITINNTAFIQNLASNIIIGKNAGNFTFTIGSAINNTIIGEGSFGGLTTGANNTIIGEDTMLFGDSASLNTVIGASALAGVTSGSRNIALGAGSGSALLSNESDNILIGNPGAVADQHTIRIGVDGTSDGEQDTCFIAGIIGNAVSNTELVTIDSITGQMGTTAIEPFADSFAGDTGTATPALGVLTIAGGTNIGTSATGSTVTVNLDNTVSISGSMTAGTGLIATTGGITATGTSNINTSGATATSIGVGGTGAVNIGNSTGKTFLPGVPGNTVTNTKLVTINTSTGEVGAVPSNGIITTWSIVTGATNLVARNGYFTNSSSTLVFTLPTTAAVGDIFEICVINSSSGAWQIAQNASQFIVLNSNGTVYKKTTTGVGGTATAAAGSFYNSVKIVCFQANTGFILIGPGGPSITIV